MTETDFRALCHVIYDGGLYNNRPAETVAEQGAGELSISVAANGIAGRGVLLDIPRARGVPWLERSPRPRGPANRGAAIGMSNAELNACWHRWP